jgi:peptide-methionine (S)-S-oxide reductase
MIYVRQFHKPLLCAVVVGVLMGILFQTVRARPEQLTDTTPLATPKTSAQAPAGKEVATLAAGCFWSMEAIFERLQGVEKVEPGYAGGHVANPAYEKVGTGTTGHAEAVSITFDPKVISYRDLLQVMLTLRDPTTLNRQGPDEGANYRSVIFYHTKEQQKAAEEAIRAVAAAKIWKAPIVTPVTAFTNFYQAEDYHRDYYRRHPDVPYSRQVIAPKIEYLHAKFASLAKP